MKLAEIADLIGAELIGDGEIEISGFGPIEATQPGEITFIASLKYKKYLNTTKASAVIVPLDIVSAPLPILKTKNPYLAYAQGARLFYRWPYYYKDISDKAFFGKGVRLGRGVVIYPLAYIDDEAEIGDETIIFPGVYVGPKVKIGQRAIVYPNVSILAGCVIGHQVVIHSGAVIGSDGFGFATDERGKHSKIAQLGIVRIEDDVEIGANTTVDRAAFGETLIKRGTKIDNLVQIAHNVQVGEDAIIVAQVGVAGSTQIGKGVTLAGQVGVAGHLKIGEHAIIGAKTGVAKSVKASTTMASGVPAMPYQNYLKTMTLLPKLADLFKQLKSLQKEISLLRKQIEGEDEE
jgi:UDP-3-O-[3-hydroxymyristoyl] glucosamine N-acyltransferase